MTKYRIKTREEFEATCEKNEFESYACGKDSFSEGMFHLFGVDVPDEIAERIMSAPIGVVQESIPCNGDGIWHYTPEMLTLNTLTLNTRPTFAERLRAFIVDLKALIQKHFGLSSRQERQ